MKQLELDFVVEENAAAVEDGTSLEAVSYGALEEAVKNEQGPPEYSPHSSQKSSPSSPSEQLPRRYHVPGMTENPCVIYGMVRRWIMDFHQRNGMKLPKGFYQRDKTQLVGMFYGMLRTYEISLDEIVQKE